MSIQYNRVDGSISLFDDEESVSFGSSLKVGLAGFASTEASGKRVCLKHTGEAYIYYYGKDNSSVSRNYIRSRYLELVNLGLILDIAEDLVDTYKGYIYNPNKEPIHGIGFHMRGTYTYLIHTNGRLAYLIKDIKDNTRYNLIRNHFYLLNLYKRYPQLIGEKGGIL